MSDPRTFDLGITIVIGLISARRNMSGQNWPDNIEGYDTPTWACLTTFKLGLSPILRRKKQGNCDRSSANNSRVVPSKKSRRRRRGARNRHRALAVRHAGSRRLSDRMMQLNGIRSKLDADALFSSVV